MRRDWSLVLDRELLSAEDADAFAVLYDRHVAAVFGWAQRRAGGYASDLTAETFARAWTRRRHFRSHPSASALPWLLGIAGNVLRESLRQSRVDDRARHRLGLPERVGPDPNLEAVEARLSLPEAVNRAIADLPASDQDLLQLRAVDGLPYREIALRLGCSPLAARLRVSRLLRQLRVTLGGARS